MVGPLPIKFIVLGQVGVGKTCLMKRFCEGEFPEYVESTLQPDIAVAYVQVKGFHIRLEIHDTLGQERFGKLPNILYRNTDGIILVCDLTQAETFSSLTSWLAEIKDHCDDDVSVVIAGNKMDDTNGRLVTRQMIGSFANVENYQFLETSAKNNINVERVFFSLLNEVLRKKTLLPECSVSEMSIVPKEIVDNRQPYLPQKLTAEKVDIISLKLHKFKESTKTEVKSCAAQTGEGSSSCSC
ncbi:Ras-related protein Rab-12, partial [Stegodyphus mimosarum]